MNLQRQQFLLIPLFSLSAYTLTILTGSQEDDDTTRRIFVTLVGTQINTPEEQIKPWGGFGLVGIQVTFAFEKCFSMTFNFFTTNNRCSFRSHSLMSPSFQLMSVGSHKWTWEIVSHINNRIIIVFPGREQDLHRDKHYRAWSEVPKVQNRWR